ncbi:antibiotic biosynthesis monooxygenase [Gorillibacterium timonense]|uniref:antibiotic biosynthesis monooxygenase n=1 Tax=Gorillibacterium timonense TaxID=1689269 RepID=UPI00071C6314|nr:antibiotic biosynthesis monooxygenase [Gorillibacterium timonense]
MFIQMKTFTVQEGFADSIVERFSSKSPVEESPGFLDLSVLVQKPRRGEQEVVVMIRWESEEHWKGWEKSEVHLEGHRQSRGKPKPEYILNSQGAVYEVKAARKPEPQS